MLRFAFLGAWHSHASMHVREAAARPGEVELVGMYDPDPAVIQQNLERWAEYGLDIPVFASIEDVLNSRAEAVVVEGHVYQNLDYAERALAAGKHVLLEKPAGVDLAQLERLHKLSETEGLMLQMAYMWRYNPAVAEMLRLVESGCLGQVFMYRGHIPKPINWHKQLYGEFTAYHGGVYFEMAGHLVDLMVAMMGEPVTIRGVLGKHYGKRAEVDNAVVVHECRDGIGIVDTTAMQIGMDRRIEVHGTQGTLLHEPLGSNKLRVFLAQEIKGYQAGEWQDVEFDPGPSPPSLLRELAACIRGEKTPDFALAHDRAVQRTLFKGCGITDGHALRA
ncbi:MAG: Gfo/Idh/MocA family oxidoreductase [Gemmatimonadota bacterium]|nr:Gfo/Idh/MocA family oxidoreductase [Gemmatimonadota bacterium]